MPSRGTGPLWRLEGTEGTGRGGGDEVQTALRWVPGWLFDPEQRRGQTPRAACAVAAIKRHEEQRKLSQCSGKAVKALRAWKSHQ